MWLPHNNQKQQSIQSIHCRVNCVPSTVQYHCLQGRGLPFGVSNVLFYVLGSFIAFALQTCSVPNEMIFFFVVD